MRQHEVIIVDDDTTLTRPSTSSPTSTAGHVNIASSRAFSMLPAFVKDHWKSQILLSVRDAIGQSRTPWDLDQKMNTFETILQTIIDTIYGPNYHKVVRGTQIYVQVSCLQLFIQAHTIDEYLKAKQAVYDWRRGIYRTAVAAVEHEIMHFERTPSVKAFVRASLAHGGAAFWGEPGEVRSLFFALRFD
jgi:hypothetical protein